MSYSLKNLQLNTAFAHIEKGNYKAAAPIIRRFAEQGDVDAQYQLAFMYEQGLGVKTDFAAAAKWYHAAAEQGDAAAQMNIATLYEDGLDGLPQDYAAALKWYGAAFEQGEWDAANALAALDKLLQGES